MTTKHTPGPWSINDWTQANTDIAIGAVGTPLIARVMLRDVSINEQKANAHLISAAPELHAELLKLADDLRSHTKDRLGATAETLAVWESRVLAAIAKATGSGE